MTLWRHRRRWSSINQEERTKTKLTLITTWSQISSSRTKEDKYLLFKLCGSWYVITAALANKYMGHFYCSNNFSLRLVPTIFSQALPVPIWSQAFSWLRTIVFSSSWNSLPSTFQITGSFSSKLSCIISLPTPDRGLPWPFLTLSYFLLHYCFIVYIMCDLKLWFLLCKLVFVLYIYLLNTGAKKVVTSSELYSTWEVQNKYLWNEWTN